MTCGTVKPIKDWPAPNQRFYADFRQWLRDGGYGDSALKLYGIAARLALGLLDEPYWTLDPDADLDRAREYIAVHYDSEATRDSYHKGLAKLAEYLHYRCNRRPKRRSVNWEHYVGLLPDWLADDVRTYVAHRRRAWVPEQQHRATLELLSHLTRSLRWMTAQAPLAKLGDLTPSSWFDYLDMRLEAGIKPATLNRELDELQQFLCFLADAGRPICQRLLRVKPLPVGPRLPRDVPVDQLKRLMQEIEVDASSSNASTRRMGTMDRAWFLVMIHCGLRPAEIRRLKSSDLDLEGRRIRVEQSKGLKDRVVYLSEPAAAALRAYLEIRGAAITDHVFVYRHRSLSFTYCNRRLRTYGRRCGVKVTAHQLRHSAATLLLNAGAPILVVQAILGHKHVDTTLNYTRLYDGTVAADYYRAMAEVEGRMGLRGDDDDPAPDPAQLLALVDALHAGTLNDAQRETVQALRDSILALVRHETTLSIAEETV
jgi:integrase